MTEFEIALSVAEKAPSSDGMEVSLVKTIERLKKLMDIVSNCGDSSFNNIRSGEERFLDTVGRREDKNTRGEISSAIKIDISEV